MTIIIIMIGLTMQNALTPAASNQTLLAAVQLEDESHRARQAGKLDAAAGLLSLSSAVRSGQLTVKQLNNNSARCRLFGGAAAGL